MKKFLIKTGSIFFILISLLTILSLLADLGLKKKDANGLSEISKGNIDADLLICGNSRARLHVSPLILDSILHVNSYNLGADALDYALQNSRYEYYNRYNRRAKYIIQTVDNVCLSKEKELALRQFYFPYLNDSLISNSLKNYTGFRWVDYHTPFMKYQGNIYLIVGIYVLSGIQGVLKLHPAPIRYKGYEAQDLSWDGSFEEAVERGEVEKRPPTRELFDAFEKCIVNFKKEKLKIVMVYTPQFIGYQRIVSKSIAVSFYQTISSKYNIPFLDYSNDSICFKKEYFYNSQHLNKKGSELFTLKLANDLKEIIK